MSFKKSSRRKRISGPERRKLLLDKALELFASRGYHAVSIDQIAAAAEVTKPVVYDHFGSKQELYLEVCRSIREALLAAGKSVIFPANGLERRIRAGVDSFFAFSERNPAAIQVLQTPPRDEPAIYAAVQVIQNEATDAILQIVIAAGVKKPSTPSEREKIRIQVEFIKQGLHGLAEWKMHHEAVSRKQLVDGVTALLCDGISGEPSQ